MNFLYHGISIISKISFFIDNQAIIQSLRINKPVYKIIIWNTFLHLIIQSCLNETVIK